MPAFVYALLAHGVLGAVDIVLNHELIARLPNTPGAQREQQLHCARELLFAAIFAGLAWRQWQGPLAWCIGALLIGELLVSCWDAVVEGATRVLPPTERVLHVLLFVNLGILISLLTQALAEWHRLPAQLAAIDYGWASWVLSAMAAGALGWAVRDGASSVRLARMAGGPGVKMATRRWP
ncbi:MAG: hypothetical protein JWR40_2068 [Massilia sp.]|jgi:hypothetical protein|nr:hypothetical protein [Massilia sp.]